MNRNFLRGIGMSINLFPTERGDVNLFLPVHSDEEAFRKDLEKVGSDMRRAMKLIEKSKNFSGHNIHKEVAKNVERQHKV